MHAGRVHTASDPMVRLTAVANCTSWQTVHLVHHARLYYEAQHLRLCERCRQQNATTSAILIVKPSEFECAEPVEYGSCKAGTALPSQFRSRVLESK